MSHHDRIISRGDSVGAAAAGLAGPNADACIIPLSLAKIPQNLPVPYQNAAPIAVRHVARCIDHANTAAIWDAAASRMPASTWRHDSKTTWQVEHDDYAAARGIVMALAICLPFWLLVFGAGWILLT